MYLSYKQVTSDHLEKTTTCGNSPVAMLFRARLASRPLASRPLPSRALSLHPASPVTFEGEPAQRTLVVHKPDAVQRALVGEITARFERKGLKLVGLQLRRCDRALAEAHYAEHRGKPFFERACVFLCSGPVVASAWEVSAAAVDPRARAKKQTTTEGSAAIARPAPRRARTQGRGAIAAVRAMLGATEPLASAPGTIRGDFGVHWRRNLVHASDGEAAAEVSCCSEREQRGSRIG